MLFLKQHSGLWSGGQCGTLCKVVLRPFIHHPSSTLSAHTHFRGSNPASSLHFSQPNGLCTSSLNIRLRNRRFSFRKKYSLRNRVSLECRCQTARKWEEGSGGSQTSNVSHTKSIVSPSHMDISLRYPFLMPLFKVRTHLMQELYPPGASILPSLKRDAIHSSPRHSWMN